MKRKIKKLTSLLLSAIIICVSITALPSVASAAKVQPALRIVATSNFFGEAEADYYTLEEDENGDAFVTLKYMIYAEGYRIINCDVDELTYDPDVLDLKEEYNYVKVGRNNYFNFFAGSIEQSAGVGMTNIPTPGRVLGNFTNISNPMYSYNKDGTAVTFIQVRFKVLDKTAGETVVHCSMESMGMCSEELEYPSVEFHAIKDQVANDKICASMKLYTVIEPNSQEPPEIVPEKGDISGDGEVDINDVTEIQKIIAEYQDENGNPLYDLADPMIFALADVNEDGKISVRDATEIQRYLAGLIPSL